MKQQTENRKLKAAVGQFNMGQERTERYLNENRDKWTDPGMDFNNYEWLDAQHRCIKTENWLEKGKVGYPKQQGQCGSCYAHSTVAAIETLAAQ